MVCIQSHTAVETHKMKAKKLVKVAGVDSHMPDSSETWLMLMERKV
jgi:hypothetical protein